MASRKRLFRAGFLVHDVSRLRRTVFDQHVRPLGITRSQWWVLANLSRHDGAGLMQAELARLLDVGKVTLGGLVDRLEEGGFVLRTPDKNDRRSKLLTITSKGFDVLKRMETVGRELNGHIMRGISQKQQEEFEEILSIMKSNLIKMDAVPYSNPVEGEADTPNTVPFPRARRQARST
jgi:DNA-binding MarR family transcriptional regulator